MAATSLDTSLLELVEYVQYRSGEWITEAASTLDLTKVPEKLHCAKCKQFLLNAYKGICCESSICESCESSGFACASKSDLCQAFSPLRVLVPFAPRPPTASKAGYAKRTPPPARLSSNGSKIWQRLKRPKVNESRLL